MTAEMNAVPTRYEHAERSFVAKLAAAVNGRRSWLCVGLDLDPARLPPGFSADAAGVQACARAIIEATGDLACSYKPNAAFYEAMGIRGLEALMAIIETVPDDVPVILDAKRGDIAETSERYARACFDWLGADAVTVSPYLGGGAIAPFFAWPDKAAFVLCATSNPGAVDFQTHATDGGPLYLAVARRACTWAPPERCGLIVGARDPRVIADVRAVAPDRTFLVPGVGAQGGDLSAAVGAAWSQAAAVPLIVNVGRGITHHDGCGDYTEGVRRRAEVFLERIRAAVEVRRDPS